MHPYTHKAQFTQRGYLSDINRRFVSTRGENGMRSSSFAE